MDLQRAQIWEKTLGVSEIGAVYQYIKCFSKDSQWAQTIIDKGLNEEIKKESNPPAYRYPALMA